MKTMKMKMMLGVTLMMASTVLVGACSDSDARPISVPDSGQTSSGLSTNFASRCARCHGTTAKGMERYPALPGTLDVESFIAVVRAGRKEMPFFDASQISDVELRSDYDWMKSKL